jgi:hypothetical protein
MTARLLAGSAVAPRLVSAGLLGLVAAGTTVVFAFDPSRATFYPSCPFHALTGLYCPGCGSTRALHELLHGHLAEAFGLNPLMVLSLPFLGYLLLPYVALGMGARRIPTVSVPAYWGWMAFWIILAYWVLRNVPYHPFTLLAP